MSEQGKGSPPSAKIPGWRRSGWVKTSTSEIQRETTAVEVAENTTNVESDSKELKWRRPHPTPKAHWQLRPGRTPPPPLQCWILLDKQEQWNKVTGYHCTADHYNDPNWTPSGIYRTSTSQDHQGGDWDMSGAMERMGVKANHSTTKRIWLGSQKVRIRNWIDTVEYKPMNKRKTRLPKVTEKVKKEMIPPPQEDVKQLTTVEITYKARKRQTKKTKRRPLRHRKPKKSRKRKLHG